MLLDQERSRQLSGVAAGDFSAICAKALHRRHSHRSCIRPAIADGSARTSRARDGA